MSQATTLQKIGWIGLGKMGEPMAKLLKDKGYSVSAYENPERPKNHIDWLDAKYSTISELSASCDIIISTISDDKAFASVTKEVIENAKKDSVYIDMSTVSPKISSEVSIKLEEKGIGYLRAPVSGSVGLAASGNVTILASGPKKDYDKVSDIFECLSKIAYYLGEAEQARYLKLSLNMMVGLTSVMFGEALMLGLKGGLDRSQLMDIVNNSAVASPLLGYKADIVKSRDYTAAFTTKQMNKDFDLALNAANAAGIGLPMTSMARQFLTMTEEFGCADEDFFSVIKLFESLSGIKE